MITRKLLNRLLKGEAKSKDYKALELDKKDRLKVKNTKGGRLGVIEQAIDNVPGQYYKFDFSLVNKDILEKEIAKLIIKDEYDVDINVSLNDYPCITYRSKLIHNIGDILLTSLMDSNGYIFRLSEMEICKTDNLYFDFDIYGGYNYDYDLWKSISLQELISYCKRLGYNDVIQVISKEEFFNEIASKIH